MPDFPQLELWFVAGGQNLYGKDALVTVREHSGQIAHNLSQAPSMPVKIVPKPVMVSADAIAELCLDANHNANCIGLIAWMHTFSPARMWIAGLSGLHKPFAHLHTQFNRELPWSTIDMEFMNLNQSAHGDREFGYIVTRMGLQRKVIAGFWQNGAVQTQLATWARAAVAWHDAQGLKIARFGDNMRNVAVTEGDKVEAQLRLGYSVSGYGVGDLTDSIAEVSDHEIYRLIAEYEGMYEVASSLRADGRHRASLREAAKIEIGLTAFLEDGGFKAFTDNFEDLHDLTQLPGVAVQRLMARGYGFGAEGDWKTAALVRAMKMMSVGIQGGTSFMEDYTYDFGQPSKVLGAHMLEVCPSIAEQMPSLEIHPLSIGGKSDPVRLVFTAKSGPAVNACLIDLGGRFRIVANEVEIVPPTEPLAKLPVARAVWVPQPNLETAATAWIYAGGSHHTGLSQALSMGHLADFAQIAGVEFLSIDNRTRLEDFRKELRWNDVYYLLKTR
ncbi:MAG TPA: L-arabinose isomerase [Terracidiphilus sp.]|nr:L-arabinose isomerase [Terracidiphilus sp.]